MKKLADGIEVIDRAYYFLLDWKDENLNTFHLLSNCNSVHELTIEKFNYLLEKAFNQDLVILKMKEENSERNNNRTD